MSECCLSGQRTPGTSTGFLSLFFLIKHSCRASCDWFSLSQTACSFNFLSSVLPVLAVNLNNIKRHCWLVEEVKKNLSRMWIFREYQRKINPPANIEKMKEKHNKKLVNFCTVIRFCGADVKKSYSLYPSLKPLTGVTCLRGGERINMYRRTTIIIVWLLLLLVSSVFKCSLVTFINQLKAFSSRDTQHLYIQMWEFGVCL